MTATPRAGHAVGDALRLVRCLVTNKDVEEVAIQCVKVTACNCQKAQAHINKFVQVSELHLQTNSEANHGMAAKKVETSNPFVTAHFATNYNHASVVLKRAVSTKANPM